ncbi:MAG: sulfatase-like hydrolase/transferase [Actinomycetota bacterium]|nr:sulfatase-like hydrolase/transferase [Actinomycetota bacterium]
MAERPNILILMTDQERYPPPYEDAALARWRRDQLPARERLRESGLELHGHHVASTACLPSRTTLFTGHYPTLHGVRNTDGLAKPASDPRMVWLDPEQVPTMGDYFRAAGYRTEYRGKWHLSHPDLPVGDHDSLLTNRRDGSLIEAHVDAYRRANRLDAFGFDGWIGAEPHGPRPENTGFVRDPLFAAEVEALFADLAVDRSQPWLTVASFVNPHDIVFTNPAWDLLGFGDIPDDIPDVPMAPSQGDTFGGRPRTHGQYRDAWAGMIFPQPVDEWYRRFYLWLHRCADEAMQRVLDALDRHGFTDDTIVLFTSDHGELLGAHGGLQQKWHNAFEETLRVPMVLSGPGIDHRPEGVSTLTSHVDVLPTLLAAAGIDAEEVAATVAGTHVEVHPLVGRDLTACFGGGELADEPVYFMTEDQISQGMRTTSVVTQEAFEAVRSNPLVESVLVPGPDGVRKLTRYHDGAEEEPADEPWEWELHDLGTDPEERTNLGPKHESFDALAATLHKVSSERTVRPHLANLPRN